MLNRKRRNTHTQILFRKPAETDDEFRQREENHEKELNFGDYKEFFIFAGALLQGLTALFADVLREVKQFFQSLWKWVKQVFTNIDEKVATFVKEAAKETFCAGFERRFEAVLG